MNICRPITFFNNFVPPSEKVQKWEYEALGYYDGISIGENLVKDDSFTLRQMWDALAAQVKEMRGEYTSQIIYLFRSENGQEVIKDQEFWEDRTEKDERPFLFITMLRLNLKVDSILNLKSKIEKEMQDDGIRLITYLSLDNNDLIVVIRSREYSSGAELIDYFHQRKKAGTLERSVIYDSFSISGVNKKCLNSPNYQFADGPRIIDKVCLRVIEKEPGSIQFLKEGLEEYIEDIEGAGIYTYPVLGCEDEVILLERIPSEKFWRLYRDQYGILSSTNQDFYRKAAVGITALVLQSRTKKQFKKGVLFEANGIAGRRVRTMCAELREKCLEFYETASKDYESREKMYYKAILQIINSLQKYENIEYIDYTYAMLYAPMKMLLELIGDVKSRKREAILSDISKFFYAINLLTQNSVRLERQFIQNVELNARIYEAPVQLSTFYTAYFSLLRDILNKHVDVKHNYEFMICPGMIEYLKVQRLLPHASQINRLLLVEIPENQMYDAKNQLVVMAHEAAHFVGRGIRMRKERYEFMLKSIVKSVSTLLILDEGMHQYCTKWAIERFEERYLEALREEADKYCAQIEKLGNGDRSLEDRYHADYILDDLWISAQNTLLGNVSLMNEIGEAAHAENMSAYRNQNMSPSEKIEMSRAFQDEFEEQKNKFLIRMTVPGTHMPDERCMNNIVDSNVHIFKESFADLISILLLGLTAEEYIDTVLETTDQLRNPNVSINTSIWRLALVIKTMCEKSTAYDEQWSMKILQDMAQKEGSSPKGKLLSKILKLLNDYLSGRWSIFELYQNDDRLKNSRKHIDRMYNDKLGLIFCDYLKLCYEQFEKNRTDEVYCSELDHLRSVYRKLSRIDNIEEYIVYLRQVIEAYKENFVEDVNR